MTVRLRSGKEYTAATRPGWPGSGVSLWGPVGPVSKAPDFTDTVITAYDATGYVLEEEPLIFLG